MTLEPKTIEYESEQYDIKPISGGVIDGDVYVDEISINGTKYKCEKSNWDTIERDILGMMIHKMENDPLRTDTSDKEYTEPKFLGNEKRTDNIMKSICELSPCTTKMVASEVGGEHKSVTRKISELKNDGLVARVGMFSKLHILVPTHVGYKEVFCVFGTPNPNEETMYESDTRQYNFEEGFNL